MRKGQRVIVRTILYPEPRKGTFVRRDMSRVLPFLVALDDGKEGWFAAVHLTEVAE